MTSYGESEDHSPMMWVRGHAIYAAHFIVLAYICSMLVTTLLMAFNLHAALAWASFDSYHVLHGQVWRVFTYGLVNQPSLWFAVDMLLIAWFGRELEKFFGRKTFLILYACLYFLSPALFTIIGFWQPMELTGQTGSFALFIAFATLYPSVVIWCALNITAKMWAFILERFK